MFPRELAISVLVTLKPLLFKSQVKSVNFIWELHHTHFMSL